MTFIRTLGICITAIAWPLEMLVLGVWKSPSGARVAWFKDPDGHTLSLTQL